MMKRKIHLPLLLVLFLTIAGSGFSQGTDCFYQKKVPLNRYNITASDTHRFIWFRIAKTGTRTILAGLQQSTQLSVNGYTVTYRNNDYEGYFKFSFVRNPWDRIVSCYFNKVLGQSYNAFQECFGKDFEYFIDFINRQNVDKADPHIRSQSSLLPLNDLDFIGRFENFEEDLKYVFGVINIDPLICHKNFSQHEHYSHYYTERTRDIIADKYKEDIENFGYKFEYR